MSDENPPQAIGAIEDVLHLRAEDQASLPLPQRIVKGVIVGLMFSALPILLTNYILTEGDSRVDPISFSAAIPVLYISLNLMKPRDRWYALGESGFALGEKYFGQVRWDIRNYSEIDRLRIEARRVTDASGSYRFTGFRYRFDAPKKSELTVEGETQELPPLGTVIHLPDDGELPERHVLRFLRKARAAWERQSGQRAEVTQV